MDARYNPKRVLRSRCERNSTETLTRKRGSISTGLREFTGGGQNSKGNLSKKKYLINLTNSTLRKGRSRIALSLLSGTTNKKRRKPRNLSRKLWQANVWIEVGLLLVSDSSTMKMKIACESLKGVAMRGVALRDIASWGRTSIERSLIKDIES